jgi:hypothetical protein
MDIRPIVESGLVEDLQETKVDFAKWRITIK